MRQKATQHIKNISYIAGLFSFMLMLMYESNYMDNRQVLISSTAYVIVAIITITYNKWSYLHWPVRAIIYAMHFVALNTIVFLSATGISVFLIYLHVISITWFYDTRGVYFMAAAYSISYSSIVLYNQTFQEHSLIWILLNIIAFFVVSKTTRELCKLESSANYFKTINDMLLENTSAGIQFIDTEGNIRLFNKACESIYNISTEDAIGKSDSDILYKGKKFDEYGNYNSLITDTLETGKKHFKTEKALVGKDGVKIIFQIETFRVYDTEEKLLGALGIYRDITNLKNLEDELKESYENLVRLATSDELTGLFNYRYFTNNLDYYVASAKLNETDVSLIMLDVDFFKEYNDRFGHPAGDLVLVEAAQVIKSCVRSSDLVARYGGEEFAVILPGQDREKSKEVAERIRVNFSNHYFKGEEELPYKNLTVSIGIAVSPNGVGSSEELLQKADTALYAAKKSGRNNVVIYSDELVSTNVK